MENVILRVFRKMNAQSYTQSVLGLIKTGPEQLEHFKTLCANAIARTIETNDVIHINRMVEASLACGRFRTFSRVVPSLVPFAWSSSDRVFSGKQQKNKYQKLMAEHTFSDGQVGHKFEALLVEYFEKEDVFGKSAPAKSWDLEEAVLRLVKKAQKEGKSFAAVNQAVEKAEKKLAS